MSINLDSNIYKEKKFPTKEKILEFVDDITIYSAYMNGKNVDLENNIISPLRVKENNPSFRFYLTPKNEILFSDFTLGIMGGDFPKFLQIMFGLTYFMALSKIIVDFNLEDHFIYKKIEKNDKTNLILKEKKEIVNEYKGNRKLGKKIRLWKLFDLIFWKQFGISKETLNKYRVEPLDFIFINYKNNKNLQQIIKAEKYCYSFIERKDNLETYKIYQPFSKQFKWISDHNSSVWQGWEQLPDKGFSLIITKSLKDVMAINETLGLASVSLQAENTIPKESIVNELKKRFKLIYVLYDNDFDKKINWGRKFGDNLQNKFNFLRLEIPDKYECTDYSDLIKKYGVKKASLIMQNLIDNVLPF